VNRKFTALLAIGCAVVAMFWPLYYMFSAVGPDWAYFDSLSLVVRSNVVSYGRFPLHEPWTLGGVDLLANPQSRVFSPMGLFDLAVFPHIANVLSLAIYAGLGAWGMASLLRYLGRPMWLAWGGALMFVGGSWFMLHFTEGHIPYGCLQMLPWVIYGLLRVSEPRAQLGLLGLLALFVVDGGMYAFIFSLYVGITMLVLGLIPVKAFALSVKARPWFLPALVLMFVALTAPKVVPVLMMLGLKPLLVDAMTLTPKAVWVSLYDREYQWYLKHIAGTPWRMHEMGCYLGFIASVVFALGCIQRELIIKNWRWIAFALVFFWIATNWLSPVNPWTLITMTPLLRNAHVQSRLFLLTYIGFIIFVTAVLASPPKWMSRVVTFTVGAAALLEILSLSQVQWYTYFHQDNRNELRFMATRFPITAREWKQTVRYDGKPSVYFKDGEGCWNTYEPALPPRGVSFVGAPDYKGEIYLTSGEGTATLGEVSPGYVALRYTGDGPATVAVNQNALFGWRVTEGEATLHTDDVLLKVDMQRGGDVVLRYHPRYWPWVAVAYVLGLVGLAALIYVVQRERIRL
jgi:hypothetical protein